MTSPYDTMTRLSPTQRYVYNILEARGSGACRRDFAAFDVWEVSNRISEIEARLNITINRAKCTVHQHRHRVVRYSL